MSLVRLIGIRIVLLSAFVLLAGRVSGQWELIEKAIAERIDTTDYVPYFYENALEYNLMIAASRGYAAEIERLLNKGADVDFGTADGVTPLIFAVASGKPEAVDAVLSYNPEIERVTDDFETALMVAVKNDYFEIAEKLIRAGADIEFRDRHGATPLHYAALYGFTGISDMLLYYDADINTETTDGSSPLLASVWAGNVMIADLLLQNGSLMEKKDNEGFTPFLLAAYFGDTLIMDLLYKKGADIFARTKKGYNSLSLAIMSQNTTAVEYLLKIEKNWAGPVRSITDPYSVAAKYQRRDVIEILKKNNIPGSIKYEVDQIEFSLSQRFTFKDNYTGFTLTFREPFLNLGLITGLDTKLWYTRVLQKEASHIYSQFLSKGSVAYAGIFKDITLSYNPNKVTTSFSTALLGGYSFGNKLKGTALVPENKFKIIPSASLRWTFQHLTINVGMEYNRSDYFNTGPLWFRAGIGYVYYFDNIRNRIKLPKWY